jgi:nickel-dependent lactate racemase
MTADEIMVKLGQDVVGTHPVVNHDWRARSKLVDLGRTPSGIPVLVNRLAVEADLLIGLGHVVPHRVAGYSGGGKIVQPGVCGGETTGRTHWLSSLTRFDRIFGKRDNPVRKEIDAIARRVGLDFIVNTVQNGDGDLVGVFAGDLEMAHRRACALAEKVCAAPIPEHADIVVVEAYPADADVWQAVKALFPAALVVKPGGVIILVSPCREGVSDQHPELLEIGYRPPLEIRSMVASRAIHDLSAAAHLAHVSEIVTGWACTFFVTPGVSREHASRLNVLWADSAHNALEWSMKVIGCSARVCVLRNGAEILPIVCAR